MMAKSHHVRVDHSAMNSKLLQIASHQINDINSHGPAIHSSPSQYVFPNNVRRYSFSSGGREPIDFLFSFRKFLSASKRKDWTHLLPSGFFLTR
jgi:hypothetical protein